MVPVRRAVVRSFAIVLLCFSHEILAHDFEGAAAYYTDDQRTSYVTSLTGGYQTAKLAAGKGRSTAARVGVTAKLIQFNEPDDLLEKQLDGKTEITEHSMTISLDQGVRVGSILGGLMGISENPLGKSFFYGMRGSQWWRKETLQTTLQIRRTVVEQAVLDFTDTDGKRVITPADVDGLNVTGGVTHITTPTTIIRGNLSRTTRSDRPAADAIGIEVRQFIVATRSAVHAALTHYENVGKIDPVTPVGSVVANTARVEWHQRLPKRFIAMGGYRYHLEVENPRATDAANNQIGSDSLYGSLRWRFGPGGWTADVHELYGFMARYSSNEPATAYVFGVGGRYWF